MLEEVRSGAMTRFTRGKLMTGQIEFYHVTVRSMGRITLPADLRRRHDIVPGDTVTVIQDAQGLRLVTQKGAGLET